MSKYTLFALQELELAQAVSSFSSEFESLFLHCLGIAGYEVAKLLYKDYEKPRNPFIDGKTLNIIIDRYLEFRDILFPL
jgi:hypothetical protein